MRRNVATADSLFSVCWYTLQLFTAFGASEAVLVPDGLLSLDLLHLENGFAARPAVGGVDLGALRNKDK